MRKLHHLAHHASISTLYQSDVIAGVASSLYSYLLAWLAFGTV
jgi:hypothetical protein